MQIRMFYLPICYLEATETIIPVVLYGSETWSLVLRGRTQTEDVGEQDTVEIILKLREIT
jgi:hypothetical protein